MTVATTFAFDIRRVAGVTADADGVRVAFTDGPDARLDVHHPRAAELHSRAAGCVGRLVGLAVDAGGGVADLNAAHETGVRFLSDDEANPGVVEVAFWGYSPGCVLTRDHPEFDRLHATLTAAAKTGRVVWVANFSDMVEVDADGGAVWCWRIMEVRDLPGVPPG